MEQLAGFAQPVLVKPENAFFEGGAGFQLARSHTVRFRSKHLKNRHLVLLALDLGAAQEANHLMIINGVVEITEQVAADDDRAVVDLGETFEARGQVDGVGDHGAFEAIAIPNRAQHQAPQVQPNANGNRRVATVVAIVVVVMDLALGGDRRIQPRIRRFGKQRHNGIANVFVNKALVVADDWADPPEVAIDESKVFRRGHLLREGGEGANV